MESNKKNYNITIDFGTCNSVISYIEDDTIKHINDDITSDVLIPTTIYFINDNINSTTTPNNLLPERDYYIGSASNDLVNSNKDYENYFFQFKRFLGITSKSIEAYKDFLHKYNFDYSVDEDTIYFNIGKKNSEIKLKLSVGDLIRLFILGLKKIICSKLNIYWNGPDCTESNFKPNIILTCPAYFHELQRSQLKRAVEQAGFEVFKLINEPTAAAVYYINKFLINQNTNIPNCDSEQINKKKFIVYDVGGGTIDTTVVEYYTEHNTCEVIDIDGNNGLGGLDIDNLLAWDIMDFYSIDKTNIKWINKIKKVAEEIKIKLTSLNNYSICLESVPINKLGKINYMDELKISYSRQKFNNLINNLAEQMILSIKNMYDKHNISNIIFIGGPTQIPLLQQKVQAIINIDEHNNIPNTIGINSNDMFLYKTIVSMGSCVLFNKISSKEDFRLLDIIPMNIGISGIDNEMIVMVEKNSKLPVSVERYFSTSHDCQRTIDIEVYEGLSSECELNTFIGKYKIINIPPLQKGMILIKLLFKISYNGILDISISGFKNPSDNSAKSFDFKLCENIKVIPNIVAKEILKKLTLILNAKK